MPITGKEFTDLEIHILGPQAKGYPVDITLNGQQQFRGYLPTDVVSKVSGTNRAVAGSRLFDALFADGELREAWGRTKDRVGVRRIRLWIDGDAPALHALPWESLQDDEVMLAAGAGTPFSRYLPVEQSWGGAVTERPIRVLAVISNPHDLQERYKLLPVDVVAEREILESALGTVGEVKLDFLDAPVTPERLEEALREDYHVLHFVGHGAFSARRGQAALYLQDENGNARPVRDNELVRMLARLGTRPELVTLIACQSATRSTADAFAGLGPKLVSIGIPAVLAMQDVVMIETARKFVSTFYQRLLEHGYVDLATNEARSTLLTAGRSDAAVPVLFMRLKDGRLLANEVFTEQVVYQGARIAVPCSQAIAQHRAALRERLETDAQARWGGMSVYIQEEGATLPIEASPYQVGRQGPRENLLGLLHAADRLLVLGEPGSGKTVTLERLAWELCNGDKLTIPVLVRLFQYDGTPLAEWMRAFLQRTGYLRLDDDRTLTAFLKEGDARCFFLFDGLNEVASSYRDNLVGELVRWAASHPRHAVVLTSRSQDELWRRLRAETDRNVVVQPIGDEQARAYLVAHLGQEKGNDLYTRLDERLQGIAQTPLVLWLIKEAGAAGESLPGNRGELYARFVLRMLRRDTDRRMDAEIPEKTKRQALSTLAYHLGLEQRLYCGQEEAIETVAQHLGEEQARTVVEASARHGLLAGEDPIWFAPHQTVQEYFAALALQEMVEQEQGLGWSKRVWRGMRRLLTRKEDGLAELAENDWWMETFVQLAGLVDDADWLAREVARTNPWLAWWCVQEGQEVQEGTREAIADQSDRLLASERVRDRRRAVEALTRMQSDRTLPLLFRAAADEDHEIAEMAAQAVAATGEAAQMMVTDALEGTDRRLWRAALRCLGELGDDAFCQQVWQNILGLQMVWVPSGLFTMGSDKSKDPGAYDDEQPQHQVTLPGYWIGKYPVTAAQFRGFVEESGYQLGNKTGLRRPDDHPVIYVTWHGAVAYCRWLTEKSGIQITLPSEAEWEKAARGTDGRIYSWGNEWDASRCNTSKGGKRGTTPVGAYPQGASFYGMMDMAGNVWEWTRSLYKEYPYDPDDGREDLDAEGRRVVRGGSFIVGRSYVRCAFRDGYLPDSRSGDKGFRLVSPISLP